MHTCTPPSHHHWSLRSHGAQASCPSERLLECYTRGYGLAFLRNKAFAALPVVMGEAAKNNDGLDAEATVGTSSPVSDGSLPLQMPPDASSYSQQTKVTMDGCKQAYERFKDQYGEPLWRALGNEALKALRAQNEKGGVAIRKRVDLFNYDIMYIPKIHHAESGPEYWIDEYDQVPWSWKAMIARMSEKDKKPLQNMA